MRGRIGGSRDCKSRDLGITLRRLVSARFDNNVLANKDEIDKNEAESYMIIALVILAL